MKIFDQDKNSDPSCEGKVVSRISTPAMQEMDISCIPKECKFDSMQEFYNIQELYYVMES